MCPQRPVTIQPTLEIKALSPDIHATRLAEFCGAVTAAMVLFPLPLGAVPVGL